MQEKAAKLKLIRAEMVAIEKPTRGYWKPLGRVLVPQSAVVELLGNARVEWLVQFFIEHPEEKILWCEQEQNINPTALFQRGMDLARVKFINVEDNLQQPLRVALDSQGYRFVVAPTMTDEVRVFQRLQHMAEKSQATVFLMGKEKFSGAWPISLQLQIDASDSGLNVEVFRQKFGWDTCE
jgi:hypothetical protein